MTVSAHCTFISTDTGYQLRMRMTATEPLAAPALTLCFSLAHPLQPDSLKGASLTERQGDWHQLLLDNPWQGESELTLEFGGTSRPRKYSDLPYGLYLIAEGRYISVSTEPQPRRTYQQTQPLTDQVQLMPRPDYFLTSANRIPWPESLHLIGPGWNTGWIERLCQRLATRRQPGFNPSGYPCLLQKDEALETDFLLQLNSDGCRISYRHAAGLQAGQAYLVQLLLQWQLHASLPGCTLSGSPRFGYRGVHLDVVRHFFSAETIADWLDLLALFHFNHFHWHLTDDDAWRVPSDTYPEIATTACWRGHDLTMPPQMGTGPAPYGGCYSKADILHLIDRARSLGIEVIPEMDIPGHARALLRTLPDLVEADDRSDYMSVQHHPDNTLNPALASTHKVITTLIDEWCELFPGPLFHLGSDEVPEGVWQQSPAALAWARQQQCPVSNLHGHFMAGMEGYLRSHGKTAMGWEEIRQGDAVSPSTWVLSWQGTEAGKAAAEAGHPVVMTPAQHCYLDLAVTDAVDDPGYYWAGTLSLQEAWRFDPLQGLSTDAAKNVRGIQACLWTELVSTPEEAEFMWFPRLLAIATVGWGANQYQTFADFQQNTRHWMALLATLGVNGRSEDQGW